MEQTGHFLGEFAGAITLVFIIVAIITGGTFGKFNHFEKSQTPQVEKSEK